MKNIDDKQILCPGCGLSVNASGECYQKYSELSAYTIGKQDLNFIHQHAVDTYAAQHSSGNIKAITTNFSLIGLYYSIEHGFNGKQVQRVHTLLSQHKYNWETLQPPNKFAYSITVLDVLKEEAGERRDKMLYNWMNDVWRCWGHEHNRIKEICFKLLG